MNKQESGFGHAGAKFSREATFEAWQDMINGQGGYPLLCIYVVGTSAFKLISGAEVDAPLVDAALSSAYKNVVKRSERPARKKIRSVYFMPNGNVGAFDIHGEQIPEIQGSIFTRYFEFIRTEGYDMSTIEEIKAVVNGQAVTLTLEEKAGKLFTNIKYDAKK